MNEIAIESCQILINSEVDILFYLYTYTHTHMLNLFLCQIKVTRDF